MCKFDYLIVGAGFAGCVMAERLASQCNKKILIVEKRNHIGGNAYDEIDEHGIFIHKYGPHLFHTNSRKVFDCLSKFTEWRKYEHRVLASLNDELYPIPINRITINKLYNLNLKTDNEVEEYLTKIKDHRYPILNSEDLIVNQVGYDLFEKFYKNYTIKKWYTEPKDISPSVCERILAKNNNDCRYSDDKYQFIPKCGYTEMFKKMTKHKNIEVVLNKNYKNILYDIKFDKIIYTGPIDYFFDYEFGRLPYRSIRFEFKNCEMEKFQEAAQINYMDNNVCYTRVAEFKQITGQLSNCTTVSFEYPQINGEPYYPIPNYNNRLLYLKYKQRAKKFKNALFCGRLAEYQYYNMEQVVMNTLKKYEQIVQNEKSASTGNS